MTPFFKSFFLGLAVLALSLTLNTLNIPSSHANEYSRGSLYCDDFQEAEEFYRREPDNKYKAAGYVICLFARGEGNDHALAMDIAENTATRFNDVNTAWRYARFIATDGEFKGRDPTKLNEAIEAFSRVWLFISETPHYPMGYTASEPKEQWTLFTAQRLTSFNYFRFLNGAHGSYNYKKMYSPNYQGDEDLELWPQYTKYTLYSLEQTIDKGRTCANLPWRSYYEKELYDQVTADCHLMKETAEELYDMEIRRLQFLETCVDILDCPEYDELADTMESIVAETTQMRRDIYGL